MTSQGSADSRRRPNAPGSVQRAGVPAQPVRPRVPSQPRVGVGPSTKAGAKNAPKVSAKPRKSWRPPTKTKAAGRGGRTSNRNTVVASPPGPSKISFGGLTISFRAIAALVIVAMVAVVLLPVGFQLADEKREYRESTAELQAAEARRDELTRDLENWENRDFVAAQARTRLGYVEKGETQFSVSDVTPNQQGTAELAATERTGPPKPWMMKIEQMLQDLDAENS